MISETNKAKLQIMEMRCSGCRKSYIKKLYSSSVGDSKDRNVEVVNNKIPHVDTDEIKKVLKGMSRAKASGEDNLSIDLIKDTVSYLIKKVAAFIK